MHAGGRPIGDVNVVARHYKVSKQFIYKIGFNRFMSSTELARRIYISQYWKKKGETQCQNFIQLCQK
jgi:hypothetical protein